MNEGTYTEVRAEGACAEIVTYHCREINKAGLPGLYSTILATAGPELCKALEVSKAAPPVTADMTCLFKSPRGILYRPVVGAILHQQKLVSMATCWSSSPHAVLQLLTEAAEAGETTLFFCKVPETSLLASAFCQYTIAWLLLVKILLLGAPSGRDPHERPC